MAVVCDVRSFWLRRAYQLRRGGILQCRDPPFLHFTRGYLVLTLDGMPLRAEDGRN